jgi:catechol 2,3-dioxygenase-like lactoylglutathione lyase family enzyme
VAKVTGIGGIFFRSRDPKAIGEWYHKWLGLPVQHPYGAPLPHNNLSGEGASVWSPFDSNTDHFGPSGQTFMINLIVDDLAEALEQVRSGGADVIPKTDESEYGKFGWFVDPEGSRVELWQPPK